MAGAAGSSAWGPLPLGPGGSARFCPGKVIRFSNAGVGLFLVAALLISLTKRPALPSGDKLGVAAGPPPRARAGLAGGTVCCQPPRQGPLALHLSPRHLHLSAAPAAAQTLFFVF